MTFEEANRIFYKCMENQEVVPKEVMEFILQRDKIITNTLEALGKELKCPVKNVEKKVKKLMRQIKIVEDKLKTYQTEMDAQIEKENQGN